MKSIIIAFLTFMGSLLCSAYEHPAEHAEGLVEKAEKEFAVAKKRLDEAVLSISDPAKKKSAQDALAEMEKNWSILSASMIGFKAAASPAPDTSTSTSLIPYYTEAEFLKHRTGMYNELAEWIETNWTK